MATVIDRPGPVLPAPPGPGPAWLTDLNPAQRAAVQHGAGALLVLAGAGTGKTATLAARVAALVLQGVAPQRLLLLSFSRRAAQTLVARAGARLHAALGLRGAQPAPQLPWAGTFHAVAARLLHLHAAAVGLPEDFGILDRGDAHDLLAQQRQALGLAARSLRFPLPDTVLAIGSRVLNTGQPLPQVLQQAYPWCAHWQAELRALLAAFAQAKAGQHLLDYDDLLLLWRQMFDSPALAAALRARFDAVLVDEYQDTNALQAEILARLRPDGQGLTVVGDDAQSIYRFRGAEVGNILGFTQRFAGARVLKLERNYRSSQPVLDACNAVIAQSPEHLPKTLWTPRTDGPRPQLVAVADELAQARWVAQRLLQLREEGLPLKRQAVLMRTGHHSATLELELLRRDIPFVKFGGLKFLEAAHVKDWLALLRWAAHPRCTLAAWRAALLVPGLGPQGARRLVDALAQAADPRAALATFRPPTGAATAFAGLRALVLQLQSAPPAWPAELALVRAWYQPQLERQHGESARVRALDIDQLERLAAQQPDRARFLAELALDPPQASSDESGPPHRDEDWLTLATIHAAKGQEWDAVSVLNVVDGCLPADLATGSRAEVEEERRLLYVACSRARTHLHLLVPLRFHVSQQHRLGDRHVYGGLSRFVPPAVAACFDHVDAGEAVPPDALDGMPAGHGAGPAAGPRLPGDGSGGGSCDASSQPALPAAEPGSAFGRLAALWQMPLSRPDSQPPAPPQAPG